MPLMYQELLDKAQETVFHTRDAPLPAPLMTETALLLLIAAVRALGLRVETFHPQEPPDAE